VKAPIIVHPWWVSFTENYTDTIMYVAFVIWAIFLGMILVAILCPAARNMRITLPGRRTKATNAPEEDARHHEIPARLDLLAPGPLLAGGPAPVHSAP
jgi:hypothetical protein